MRLASTFTAILAVVAAGACELGQGGAAHDGGDPIGDAGGRSDGQGSPTDGGGLDGATDGRPLDGGPADADIGPDARTMPPLIEGLATLAGTDAPGLVDGSRAVARFDNPVNMVSDADGTLLVADQDGDAIRRVTAAGDVTTVVAPAGGFRRPFGMVRSGTTLFVQTDLATDGINRGALWRVALPGGERTLLLEEPGVFASRYRGLGLLSDGRLVLVNYIRNTIHLLDPDTLEKTLLAGADNEAGFVDSATGSAARFDRPYDVLVLPGDILLVADFGNHRVRLVTTSGAVSTYAGTGTAGVTDGPRLGASFNNPQGLAIDSGGNLYVSDPGSYLIRRIDAAGDVTTVAGNQVAASVDSADPLAGSLHGLEGLEVEGDYLYISDGNRGTDAAFHRIRRLSLH